MHYVETASTVPFDATVGVLAPASDVVAVVSPDGVLAGAVDARTACALPASTAITDAMTPAPGTIRPELLVEDVAQQLRNDGVDHVFVTTIAGVLLGIVRTEHLHV